MARASKLDNGITQQQEKFARFYVAAFANITDDGDDIDIAVEAYKRAYNCSSDSKEKTWRDNARRLMNNSAITARIAQLRAELSALVGMECVEIVSNNVKAYRVDPLQLTVFDKEKGKWRLRQMHEIRKEVRDVMPYKITSKGTIVPDIDRNVIQDRIIRILGYEATKKQEVGVTVNSDIIGDDWIIGLPESDGTGDV